MEQILERAFLYDFYGELLTAHQRQIYEEIVLDDLSLGEAAEQFGISRQAVHDLVKRCDKQLKAYEDKLHLIEKFMKTKERVEEIHEIIKNREHFEQTELFEKIEHISKEILEQL